MLVQFFDTDAGTTVYINPEYVVTLRPDPETPERSETTSVGRFRWFRTQEIIAEAQR
jgi:hypothetical protein